MPNVQSKSVARGPIGNALYCFLFLTVSLQPLSGSAQPDGSEAPTQADTSEPVQADDVATKELLSDLPGQQHLDEAIERRVQVRSVDDLDRVIRLCETALEKGLDDANTELAKETLAYTLHYRAEQISRSILDRSQRNRQAAALRRFALRDLKKAIEVKEDIGVIHLLLAKLLVLSPNDRAQAKAAAARAIELLAENNELLSEALVIRGRAEDDAQKQLADWDKAIELDARNLDAWRSRGLHYLSNGSPEKALSDLQTLLEQDPKDVVAHQVVAEVLTRTKEFDKATEHLNKLIDLNPNSAIPYTLRARVRIAQGNTKDALSDLNQGLQVQPTNIAALLMRSSVYNELGDHEAALTDVDQVMALDPEMLSALMQRSLIYYQQGRLPEAIADLRQLIRRDNKNVDLNLQLAIYYLADKRPRKAIETYSNILNTQTDNLKAIRGRADALLAIGRQAEAIADYENVLRKSPDESDALNNLAWVLATSPEDDLRNGRRAIELATRACEVTEYQRPHIISTLAASYAETGDFETAIEWSNKALELSQKSEDTTQEDLDEQLSAELQSYKKKQPWREQQSMAERKLAEEPNEDDLRVEEQYSLDAWMEDYKRQFIEFMVRAGVLTFGDFVTKSGRKTPYFINTGLYSTGDHMLRLGRFYADAIQASQLQPDVLFGPAYKGIPLVVATAAAMAARGEHVAFCFNRKEVKGHGEGGVLVGHSLHDGQRVLIVEDVTTAGTSIRETVPILRQAADILLAGLVVSVDRCERGMTDKAALAEVGEEFGMQTFSIVTVHQVIEHLSSHDVDGRRIIDSRLRDRMCAYLDQYAAKES